MMKIINKTPHPVHIVNEAGSLVRTFSVIGEPIRLIASTEHAGYIDGVLISQSFYGAPENLPEPHSGTYYIVSQLVKSALPERDDLLVPAEVVRDELGNIIGCRSLGQ